MGIRSLFLVGLLTACPCFLDWREDTTVASLTQTGNLVANPGFIEQMGTFISERTGVTAIDPVHITLWSISVSLISTHRT